MSKQSSESTWYHIRNASGDTAEIDVYGFIGKTWDGSGTDAAKFRKDMRAIKASKINLRLNSEGGNVFDGVDIYNTIRQHKAHVAIHIGGLAASIASVIAMAGDEIHMAKNGFLMMHNPSDLTWGTAEDMRKTADNLDKIKGKIAQTYADRGNQSVEKFSEMMNAETWLTAEEAKDYGLIDVISGESKDGVSLRAAACLRFPRVPETVKAIAATAAKPEVTNVAKNESTKTVSEDVEGQAETEAAAENDGNSVDADTETAEVGGNAVNAAKPATTAELKAGIPTCTADFREVCVENKLTLAQAKAMFAIQATAAKAPVRAGGAGIKDRPASTVTTVNSGDFMALVDAYQVQNKCGRRDALRAIAQANPSAHEAWCTAQGKVTLSSEASIGRSQD